MESKELQFVTISWKLHSFDKKVMIHCKTFDEMKLNLNEYHFSIAFLTKPYVFFKIMSFKPSKTTDERVFDVIII